MDDQRAKRKAEDEIESDRSIKRIRAEYNTDISRPYQETIKIIKEGILRKYDGSKNAWTDASVKLYSNADFEWKLLYDNSNITTVDSGKTFRVRIKPSTQIVDAGSSAFILNDSWPDAITNVPHLLFMAKTVGSKEIQCISVDRIHTEQERWLHLMNFTLLKRALALKRHNHPMTLCCNLPAFVVTRPDLVGPEIINTAEISCTCYGCGIDARESDVLHCEFCDFNICLKCSECLSVKLFQQTEYSVNHPKHPLVKFFGISDVTWFPRSYREAGFYLCSICKQQKSGQVHHCVECGNYDECPECFVHVTAVHEPLSVNHIINDDLHQLDIGLLSHLITKSGNEYEMDKKGNNELATPRASSMISKRSWDLTKIDLEAVPSAYFEVTVLQLEGKHVVVGVADQNCAQNQLLGYQQNSFGYCCNGQVTHNIGTDMQFFPSFGTGDTTGVGMLLDSFNMRRLFFTKNGVFVGCFNEPVPVGMECFPGVSIRTTTCQSVKVSMNMTGPFKFDLSSVPDHRQDRHNWLEQLPIELICKCLSYVTNPQQFLKLFCISKQFESVVSDNEVWKNLFLYKWPLQNSKLRLKSWMRLYEWRYKTEKLFEAEEKIRCVQRGPYILNASTRRYPKGVNFIENCSREFDCPLTIEDLKLCQTSDLECHTCHKFINQVNEKEAKKYATIGPYIITKSNQSDREEYDGYNYG